MKSSIISVIIPVYNAANVIEQCVKSTLSQNLTSFELILVDDGSDDGTEIICDELAKSDERIRVIHIPNGGVSNARNTGIAHATGKYIVFIDADDYVTPQYLSAFSLNDELDIQVQGFTLCYEDGKANKVVAPVETQECGIANLIAAIEPNGLVRGPVCKLFKSAIIKKEKLLFPSNLTYGEDAVFVKRYLLHCNKAKLIATSNYFYTHTSNESLTSRFHSGEELMEATRCDFKCFTELDEKNNIDSETCRQFKWYKAIDFYQAIYNILISPEKTISDKVRFIKDIDTDLYHFIKDVNKLPIKFKIEKFCLKYLSITISVSLLTWLFKK